MIEETLAAILRVTSALEAEMRDVRAEMAQLRRAVPARLVSVRDAVQLLGVSESTVRRLVKRGEIPSQRVGGAIRLDITALRPKSRDEIGVLAQATRAGKGAA